MPSPSFAQSNAMSVGLNRTKITAQGLKWFKYTNKFFKNSYFWQQNSEIFKIICL